MKQKYKVIVEDDIIDPPKPHELKAALIIASYFRQDIIFLRTGNGKAPDLNINGVIWEIKSPKGGSKNTMENNIREATKQSRNIIIDLNRCKLSNEAALIRIKGYLKNTKRHIPNVLVIKKGNIVIDITGK